VIGAPRAELGHLFVPHISHLDRGISRANIAPMPVIAAQTLAVAAFVANEDVGLDVWPQHACLWFNLEYS
jgi:hypothetical protein